ncbi:hypothetical protein HWV62_15539 [Athelia sp. TMB]|nr:hypothetical protein HWV62_15539 [Athelia sp. TMB]
MPLILVSCQLFDTKHTAGDVCNIFGNFYEANDEPHALDILKLLDPVTMNATYRRQCMAGTRDAILKSFCDDLTTASPETNAIWLTGVAGSGKSTIATTIAERLQGQLGAFLFFDRNSPSLSTPDAVIRTLAYQLAMSNKALRDAICNVIELDPQIATRTLSHQFSNLLFGPLQSCSKEIIKPIVIILDAFDECGDPLSRRALAYLLAEKIPSLPPQFRFLITGRPQLDLVNAFTSRPRVKSVSLNASEWKSEADVLLYIQHDMNTLYQSRQASDMLPPGWPSKSKVQQLGARAADSFIYAATAMRYLFSADDVVERLDSLLAQTAFTLEDLYATALRSASNWDPDEVATESCRKILGAVVVGRIALTDDTIVEILGFEKSKACRLVLRNLACVLQWSDGSPVRTLHASFADYLTDHRSCAHQPWFVDETKYHVEFTIGCLRVMERLLRFNMCHLATSYLRNQDVENLEKRISEFIPQPLSYSCRFWAEHLKQANTTDLQIISLVLQFFQSRFLYWLEVLSLIGESHATLAAMRAAENTSKDSFGNIRAFAKDGSKFVRAFASVISDSASHIYISALPFAPSESIIKQQYSTSFKNTLCVQSGIRAHWPPCELVIEEHTEVVQSVAFSPNGERIASGSNDNAVRIWDSHTGKLIAGPFEGHHNWVMSIAFSPDGERVASGAEDMTIRIWDAWTGELLAGPFEGHTGGVNSVAYSPDGQRIVSGSADRTVCIWDPHTGKPVSEPFLGHTGHVSSVMFSPNGELVVSGSWDQSIRMWNARTGELVGRTPEGDTSGLVSAVAFSPDGQHIVSGYRRSSYAVRIWDVQSLRSGRGISRSMEGRTGSVYSVAFSLDGRHVAAGSVDKAIYVWNAQTGELITEPLVEHTDQVTSVAFSRDGERIVSASHDTTVRVWELQMGIFTPKPHEGYTDRITSAVFSPDGEYIATASGDETICVWDARRGHPIVKPFKGHTSWIMSIAFSPDGGLIASGSADNTIRVWNARTGEQVAMPFNGHTDVVNSVAFSPNGEHIVSGSDDETVRVWGSRTGNLFAEPFKGHNSSITSVAFSPDGDHIVTGSDESTIRVWNIRTGELVSEPFIGHSKYVNPSTFSSDGIRVVSGLNDTAIQVWDTRTGDLVAGPLEGHTDLITTVAISPDGEHVVSCSIDMTMRVFGLAAATDVTSDKGYCRKSRLENGWMQNSPTELLFWVPPTYRAELWRPYNTFITGQHSTRLDLTRFVHGGDWMRCHASSSSQD